MGRGMKNSGKSVAEQYDEAVEPIIRGAWAAVRGECDTPQPAESSQPAAQDQP